MAVATLPTLDAGLRAFSQVQIPPDLVPDDEDFVVAAEASGPSFDPGLAGALDAFGHDPGPAGALLVRRVPTSEIPATPAGPTVPTSKDLRSELALLAVARRLGEPVGYQPEHGGSIVQNLVP